MSLTRLLFIGLPGAGKGTQAKLLNLTHISTGDVIKNAFANKDSLLLPYQESINKGELLPDERVFKLIEQHIQNLPPTSKGYILDGAVRTIPQAEFVLNRELIDAVFEFRCSEREAIRRIGLRRGKENRKEDSPEAIKIRFREYYEKTYPAISFLMLQHYDSSLRYFTIDAEKSIEEVHKEISNILYD
ncbi:MAG: nucleoside monophosphate kinase [Nanoarchaeota archaeon]